MRISIFGLGYVGCVSLGCLAKNGHHVIGVDVNQQKVDLINQGLPTIVEYEIDEIIAAEFKNGKIKATTSAKEAILDTSISIICVGTPSTPQGHLNLAYIYKTAEQIGIAIKEKDEFHTVVIRSTVMPGTNEKLGEIIEQYSGKKRNMAFSVVSNPEFLREGTAVKDYYNPSITVIGGDNEFAMEQVAELYKDLPAPIEKVDIKVAEMIKYVNNSFHALKITFANEVGNIAKSLGIDSHKVMELFCKDTHLNISPNYFKSGFAYGGSCLPKDLGGLITIAKDNYLDIPMLSNINDSNEYQKKLAFDLITTKKSKKITFLGLAFKEGTDDLRYSPFVDVAEKLLGKGYELCIYDPNVHISKLIGTNKSYIDEHLPHLSKLITDDLEVALQFGDIVLINHRNVNLEKFINYLGEKEAIIDLVRIKIASNLANYQGLCW
ncbi:MAG: UDP-glucose/GDP-mannose dehydrogenase family protein [Chitinophagales bacterium]|nr:UDP-glucose/GDP-mannose dehydrogenase family protein [Chitinophagales bacterium]